MKILENIDENDIQELNSIRNQAESYQNELNEEVTHKLNENINKIFEKYI